MSLSPQGVVVALKTSDGIRPVVLSAVDAQHLADVVGMATRRLAESDQYDRAIDLAIKVMDAVSSAGGELRMTGHSLGGGLATVAGVATKAEAVTFNAASVHGRYWCQAARMGR